VHFFLPVVVIFQYQVTYAAVVLIFIAKTSSGRDETRERGRRREEPARRTLIDGLEGLLVLLGPVGLHELELRTFVGVPAHRLEAARLRCDRSY
jgi:hypothetical protein